MSTSCRRHDDSDVCACACVYIGEAEGGLAEDFEQQSTWNYPLSCSLAAVDGKLSASLSDLAQMQLETTQVQTMYSLSMFEGRPAVRTM